VDDHKYYPIRAQNVRPIFYCLYTSCFVPTTTTVIIQFAVFVCNVRNTNMLHFSDTFVT